MKTYINNRNFDTNPLKVYVSKTTGRIYPEKEDGTVDLKTELKGLSLLLYNYSDENNLFKVFTLKDTLR